VDAGDLAQPPASARHVSVAAARLGTWIDGFRDRHGDIHVDRRDATVATVALVAADGARAWIEVPFLSLEDQDDQAPAEPTESGRPDVLARLVRHVERRRWLGVILVRRGGHAAGVFHGLELTASKVGSSYVQGTTKAGGWSQQRYARRRANQATAAFAKAADTAVAVLGPVADSLEGLVVGGDRAAVEAVLEDQRLAELTPKRVGRLLVVPDPRLSVLRASPDQFLAVRIAVYP
jgi:hypothetical protein